jgi:sec-independent protein translocase protein TatA
MLSILGLGSWELIAVLVVVLLLFGHRIPGMARALGSGITEFKKGLKDGSDTPSLPGSNDLPRSDKTEPKS